jgi:cyclopropane-fatty-acyl-phospholipid synthase
MLSSRLLSRFERRLKAGDLPLAVRLWNGTTLIGHAPPRLTVVVNTPEAVATLAEPTMGSLARCYVEQQIDVEGNARDILRIGEALSDAIVAVPGGGRRSRSWFQHTRLFDREAIQSHYDAGDNFFELWLDANRVYSCAYFRRADDTLEIAQEQKLDHICRKLRLAPGERFLDIGCGWGALVIRAAQRFGVNALGITLSKNQYEYARTRIRELGIDGRCEVRLLDYRDVPEEGGFDKIASVGMFEHVGLKNFPLYFGKIFRLLKPGGLVMNHGITHNRPGQHELGSGMREFIERYVFPGGELAHVSQMIAAMSDEGLEPWDVESLRPHYGRTLWEWVDRLDKNRAAAVAAVGEKAYRIWRIYMAGSANSFERGWLSVYQVLAGKPRADGALELPPTRDHIYAG